MELAIPPIDRAFQSLNRLVIDSDMAEDNRIIKFNSFREVYDICELME